MTRFRPELLASLILLGGLTGGFWSCSQHSNSSLSKGYHNLTAHYNAYVMARDDIDEVERFMFKNRQDNYNEPLPILLPLDSNATQSVRPQLDDAIKKASLVAERHQNSKWVDDAYILIGKTRLYRQDLPNAIEVFKYVNTKGTDDNNKHEALIYLMRAYTEAGDFTNGLTVAEYLRNQPLNKENTRDFYLTKAYLHQRKGEPLLAAGILEATFPFLKKSEAVARLHLIAGQLYELAGQNAKATEQFQQVLRTRPNYDQEFFANIYLMQADGNDARQSARNAERFEEMLSDRKNSDLKDKIYFTMGRADVRRGNYDRALVNFNRAVQTGISNTAQVPLTYAEMGNLYFEKKRNYAKAQAYYDSSLALLPQNHVQYTTLANRKKALDEFVNNQTTIDREDSLQRMAQMNPAALDQLLDRILDQREKDAAAQAALAQQVTGRTNQSGAQATNSNLAPNDRWILYNPVQLVQGRQEFMQVWGNRPLADDWRRQNKSASEAIAGENSPLNGNNPANATSPATPIPAAGAGMSPPVVATLNQRKAQKDELYRQIPFSAEAVQKSNDQLESALYRQGKLYKFQFNQPALAMTTLDRLLVRFPNSSYRPEAYYLMHLSAEQLGKAAPWRDKLLTEFPTSTYAKLLTAAGNDPVLADGSPAGRGGVNEVAANQTYAQVYKLYESGNSTEALARIEAALGTFGGSKIADKMALLRIMLIGRVQSVDAYRQALGEFVRDYPLSSLLPYVKERQVAAEQLTAKRK